MTELEKLDSEILALRRKRIALVNSLPKPIYDLNDIPVMKLRASGKRFDTRIKVQTKTKIQKQKIMKSKITLAPTDVPKALVASRFAGVSVDPESVKQVSPKKTSMVLTHSSPNELLEMGGYLYATPLSDADVKKGLDDIAAEKKAAEAKAAQAAKK